MQAFPPSSAGIVRPEKRNFVEPWDTSRHLSLLPMLLLIILGTLVRGKIRHRGQSVNAESGLPQSPVLWGFGPCKLMFFSVNGWFLLCIYSRNSWSPGLVLELQPHKVPMELCGTQRESFVCCFWWEVVTWSSVSGRWRVNAAAVRHCPHTVSGDSSGEDEEKPGLNPMCYWTLPETAWSEVREVTWEGWAEGTALRCAWYIHDILKMIFAQGWESISLHGLNVWVWKFCVLHKLCWAHLALKFHLCTLARNNIRVLNRLIKISHNPEANLGNTCLWQVRRMKAFIIVLGEWIQQ